MSDLTKEQLELRQKHFDAAYDFSRNGKLQEAIRENLETVAIDPKFADAYRNLGSIKHRQGKDKEAIDFYERCLALEPNHEETHFSLGYLYHINRRLDEAIREYKLSIAIEPKAKVYNNLGMIYSDRGDRQASLDAYRQAIYTDSGFVPAHNNLAKDALDAGQFEVAILQYQKTIALDPSYSNGVYGLALCFAAASRWDETAHWLEQTKLLQPDFKSIDLSLARAYAHTDQVDKAIQNYRIYLLKHKGDKRAWSDLGFCYLMAAKRQPNKSNGSNAMKCFMRSFALNPFRRVNYTGLATAIATMRKELDEEAKEL